MDDTELQPELGLRGLGCRHIGHVEDNLYAGLADAVSLAGLEEDEGATAIGRTEGRFVPDLVPSGGEAEVFRIKRGDLRHVLHVERETINRGMHRSGMAIELRLAFELYGHPTTPDRGGWT